MDSLRLGLLFDAGQVTTDAALFQSTVPLAPGAVFASPWLDISGSGDPAYFNVQAFADQLGSLQVFEGELESAVFDAIGGCVISSLISPGCPVAATGVIFKRFVRFVFTNGPIAQTVFAVSLSVAAAAPITSAIRIAELTLRELRSIALLIASLKEPGTATVNLPFGPPPSTF